MERLESAGRHLDCGGMTPLWQGAVCRAAEENGAKAGQFAHACVGRPKKRVFHGT